MTGDLIGADVVKNEITSQARASAEIDPSVDTIFEIGGQDSKYISLRDGVIVDFEMNKVCAAGTGSFLEEQAERLDLNIVEEFANCAFEGAAPVNLGERCTVFMQSNLTSWQQKGAKREDLAAGLAYSIAHNYLNRVVANKRIGEKVFFQGAVAHNKAIVSAFNEVLGKPVHVPPNNDVTGAIGVAILAMEHMQRQTEAGQKKTTFRGFDLCEREYDIERFDCTSCPNQCEIKKVNMKGEEPLYYGSRCDKYEKRRETKDERREGKSGKKKEDLFKSRERFLLKSYDSQVPAQDSKPVIGIPKALTFHEYLPFWAEFFKELGCTVVLSDSTNKRIIHSGVESCVSDHCFPIKACHGHVLNLVDKGVDYIFLPSLINMEKEQSNIRESYACPFIQAVPYVIKAALDLKGIELLIPILHLKREKKHLAKVLVQVAGKLGRGKREALRAMSAAELAQGEFYRSVKAKGADVLREIGSSNHFGIVIVGRPYNTCDMGLNLNIPKILEDLGIPAIPVDFLPTEGVDISKDWANMYWRYGQRILAAAKVIRDHPNLYPLYVTNFGCGADSFIQRYFEHEMGKKPHLILEVDEHSAPAGVITRCEAFLDSIQNKEAETVSATPDSRIERREDHMDRTLLIPFMGNHSHAVAAAFRHCGIDSQVIPIADRDSVELGRKHSTGKECYPCIITTGDMIKVLESGDWDRDRVAFFMPEASGPCRFGQYNKLQRLILKEAGYEDVCIVSPNQAKDMYKTINQYGGDFNKRGWFSFCAIDILDKLVRATRPYEVEKGQADAVYQECLDEICREIEGKGDIFGIMREVKKRFESVPVKREPKPFIGVAGEIYVRNHHFSNENLVRTIEELGGEVVTSTSAEWLFYINARQKEQCMIDRNYTEMIQYAVKDRWQKWTEHKMAKEFEGFLEYLEEPTIKQLFSYSDPYLHQSVEGEATLTVAKCLDFIKKKADGLITVMPFSCMPGTNVSAVMEGIKKELNIPYLNLVYDGLEQSTTQTRLEAFMHQAQQYMRRENKPQRH
jgi:predicted CoA-substrate-specific enzyme activase